MIDNIKVGKTIAGLRQNRRMTQQQLAAALNVSHQAVSKWETGAALPDVQTLMALTNLFGVTVEQLLNGEVPEDRLGAKPTSPFDEPIQNIGNFFNNIVNDIFHPDKKDAAEDDDASDPESVQPEEGNDAAAGDEAAGGENADFDIQNLLQLAPFMSKSAVDAILLANKDKLSARDIARFAPFISQECLLKLVQNADCEINWDILRRIAPFLKREVVDRLGKAAAQGNSFVKKAVDQSGINTGDIGKAIDDASDFIGAGVEKAIRKVSELGNGVAGAINDLVEGVKGEQARVDALRRAAYERALQDEKWDWLAAHIDEIKDEELLRAIAQKANGLGMHDWVLEHLNGYADTRTIDAAIESGNWGWLGDHAWQFEDELQEKIARAAAQAENWQWLSTYSEQISLEHCADEIGIAAYKADARILALQLAEHCMNAAQREALADAAVGTGDFDFLDQLSPLLDDAYFGRLCVAHAQEKQWDAASRYVGRADRKSIEQMMELAIAEGNFDAVDIVNAHL